ncbi:hypothetical protein [Parapedobacter sp. 10938]|uniref:hypothetical protein n=1 Tax=Parapedobacter flavus TaxID=3110225 RepID=UPI002DB8A3F3|nr:hypothetical protein [Parapedobacter sp. 10938]MEC3880275.1 hypothetical protein [Parapedobacter sp. 10938]
MKLLSELNTFTSLLTGKGYTGYFHTQGAYAGKLKESILEYLENCRNGKEQLPESGLLVSGYLQWTGEDQPRVECSLWIKYLNGKFFLNRMEVIRKDRFGQLLKKMDLKKNLSVATVPGAKEAIAMVTDTPEQKAGQRIKRSMH